jgi:hypothetical protein
MSLTNITNLSLSLQTGGAALAVKAAGKANSLPFPIIPDTFLRSDSQGVQYNAVHRAEYVDIRDFGAVGDGVADNTTAIQSAFDDGRPVYIPAGVWAISDSLELTGSNAFVFGDGAGSVIKLLGTGEELALGLHEGMLNIHGSNSVVKMLQLDGSYTGSTEFDGRSSGIYFKQNSSNCRADGVICRNMTRHGICINGTNNKVGYSQAYDNVNYGMSFGDGLVVAPSVFGGELSNVICNGSKARAGIEVNDGAFDVTIDGFYCFNNSDGGVNIRDHNRSGERNGNLTITNGVIVQVNQSGYGVRVAGTSTSYTHTNVEISHITIKGTGDPGCVQVRGNVDGVFVSDIRCEDVRRVVTTDTSGGVRPKNIRCDKITLISTIGGTTPAIQIIDTDGFTLTNSFIVDSRREAVTLSRSTNVNLYYVDIVNPNTSLQSGRSAIMLLASDSAVRKGFRCIGCTVRDVTNVDSALLYSNFYDNAFITLNELNGGITGDAVPVTAYVSVNT